MSLQNPRTYLALGDSMSIDDYTGVEGGGAASQLAKRLGSDWQLANFTSDGCTMPWVPRDKQGELITLTIGGNDLLMVLPLLPEAGLGNFAVTHLELLQTIREHNPDALFVVGNIYQPDFELAEGVLPMLDEVNEIIAENAVGVGAFCADLFTAFAGRTSELITQEIEPNLAGATVIADVFEEIVRRELD